MKEFWDIFKVKTIDMLTSKRFQLAVVGVVQIIVLDYYGVDPKIWQTIATLLGILIGGYTISETGSQKR